MNALSAYLIAEGILLEHTKDGGQGPSCSCGGEDRGHVQGCAYEAFYERIWERANDLAVDEGDEVEAARLQELGRKSTEPKS